MDRYINADELLNKLADDEEIMKDVLDEYADKYGIGAISRNKDGRRENVFRIGRKGTKCPATKLFQEYKDIVNDFLEVLEKNIPMENYHKCAEITEALTKSVIDDFEAKNCWYTR